MRMPVMESNEGEMGDLLSQLSCRRNKVISQPEICFLKNNKETCERIND
jgi:hypothetical protein